MLEVVEYDEAGNVTATYVESGRRLDVILPEHRKPLVQQALDVFLPAGYPQSVTDDYLPYQVYDSLQAFSSSIAGLLSSRAVLEGVGVGDASASPTAALLLSVLQESTGRVATILFAARLGTSLEPECKAWRLAADFFNDAAMLLDCVSPALPRLPRVLILSVSSILRALCGVAAGSSKASLSAHFAKQQNLGELNAKDSSQETIISLMGMLAGSVVVSWVSSPLATWLTMVLLLTIHLATNYMAVRSVSMTSLNRQRATIVLAHLLAYDKVLSPQQVSRRERVFEVRDGALRSADDGVIGRCRIGVRLAEVVARLPGSGPGHERTGAVVRARQDSASASPSLSALLKVFEHESYVLWFDAGTSEALVVLKQGSSAVAQVQAWAHALLLASRQATSRRAESGPRHGQGGRVSADDGVGELRLTLEQTRAMLGPGGRGLGRLAAAGWELGVAGLETRSGRRAAVRRAAGAWPEAGAPAAGAAGF